MSQQSPRHRIGDAARLSGVPAATIRYYEKEGLLSSQTRAHNRYRLYSDAEVHRLRFVRLCRAMDMSLGEVRALLQIDARGAHVEGADHAACQTLDEHLEHVRTRLAELQVLEHELQALRGRCDGTGGQCHVIEALHQRADAEPLEPGAGLATGKRHV
ncbi:MerR family transcriptional regulator [Melaminivora sp.]|uniref:MerR family transcriptional regulator n=1 Tax=Melaminivora sp. TaxID=1933032 RepID=UPI0028AAFB38|nr:MerR family transcriptional regulator [Melaminivora sp.]